MVKRLAAHLGSRHENAKVVDDRGLTSEIVESERAELFVKLLINLVLFANVQDKKK